jgi:hypothetical protein
VWDVILEQADNAQTTTESNAAQPSAQPKAGKKRTRKKRLKPHAQDIVWGADEIAKIIGTTPRKTFHLLERGLLPARRLGGSVNLKGHKVGGRWCASRSALLAYLAGDALLAWEAQRAAAAG